jgi:ankyrin repeat protein
VLKWLVKDLNMIVVGKNMKGQTALHMACRAGAFESVQTLLFSKKPNEVKKLLAATDSEKKDALWFGCEGGNHQLVQFLLQQGADLKKTGCPSELLEQFTP